MCTSTSQRVGLRGHGGFTIVELLVVVAIIAALISLLIPVARRATYTARLAVCQSNLRQVSIAALNGAADHRGKFPRRKVAESAWPYYAWLQHSHNNGKGTVDDRPLLREYLDLSVLECPMSRFPVADTLETANTYQVVGSYEMYFSIKLNREVADSRGFYKPSDRPTYTSPEDGKTYRWDVLAGDMDLGWDGGRGVWDRWTSHEPRQSSSVLNQQFSSSTTFTAGSTISFYQSFTYDRGPIDRNFVRVDGSGFTLPEITARDPRMIKVYFRPGDPSDRTHTHIPHQ